MSPTTFHWVVEKFENGKAVLSSELGECLIPRSLLPSHIKEGDVVMADFFLAKDEKSRRENLARALLREILGS